MLHRCGQTNFMTILTIDSQVFSGKFIIGFIMVESVNPLNLMEGLFSVTFLAVQTEFVLVYICMTTVAVRKGQSLKNLCQFSIHHFGFMAFFAGYLLMQTRQGVPGFIVIKTGGALESFVPMTVAAVSRHLTLMVIFVTGDTLLTQSEVSVGFLPDFRIFDMCGGMAFGAIPGKVFTLQFITG